MMWWSCRHQYDVLIEHYEPPIVEALSKGMAHISVEKVTGDLLLIGHFLVILQCRKCGKLDKTMGG